MAQFYGSANPGLGFFHVEVDGPAAIRWLNMENVGIAIVAGEITMEELRQNFSEMWKTNWPCLGGAPLGFGVGYPLT